MGKGGGSAGRQVAIEPLKSADQTMQDAADASSRAQQLRRGLASTFSRSGMGGSASGSSATSGTAAKLGA